MERLQDMFFLLVLRLKTGVSGTISFRPSLGTAICKRTLPWTCHDISLYFSVLSTADAPMTASQRMVLGQIDGFCNGLVKVSRMHTIMSIQKNPGIDWNLTRINRTFLGQNKSYVLAVLSKITVTSRRDRTLESSPQWPIYSGSCG